MKKKIVTRRRVAYVGCLLTALMLLSFSPDSYSQPAQQENIPVESYERAYYSQVCGFNIPEKFNCKLYDEVYCWLGTPYRYAGKNEKGIDCSGFVNMLYQKVYGVSLMGNSTDL